MSSSLVLKKCQYNSIPVKINFVYQICWIKTLYCLSHTLYTRHRVNNLED